MLKKIVRGVFSPKQRFWTVEEVRSLVVDREYTKAEDAAKRLYVMTPNRDWTQICILAEIAFLQNRDVEAESGFRDVLKAAPGFAEAHYGLSLLLHEQGHTEVAIEHAQFAKAINPIEARYLAQLGLCNVTVGNFPGAESPLRQAVLLNDKDKASWNNLGVVLRAKGEPGEAYSCFARALKLDSLFALASQNIEQLQAEIDNAGSVRVPHTFFSSHVNSDELIAESTSQWETCWIEVNALRKEGSADAALVRAEDICLAWPELSGPVCKLAALYEKLGDLQGGIDALQAYLVVFPNNGEVHATLGAAFMGINAHTLAAQHLMTALEEGYENAKVYTDLAQTLNRQEKHAEAIEFRRLAVNLDSSFTLRAKLAGSLVTACQYEEAIKLFEELLAEDPKSENLFLASYASALAYLGYFKKALALMDKALTMQPHEASLRLQRAQINLILGDFDQGWKDYAFRGLAYTKQFRVLPFTKWQGDDLKGKCIVVLAEQGLGDQVMFASCLPDLYALGPSRIVVEAIGRVAPTLARSFPECEVIHTRQDKGMKWVTELGHVDYFVPLGNLPSHFRSNAYAFPGRPYLKPDPNRVLFWRNNLEAIGPRPWIGVSWRGGTQVTRQVVRSMMPCDLAPIADGLNATWISLQYGDVTDELKNAEVSNFKLSHWPEAIADLDEFAALIDALDCVVSVCNTTVHYAGALGKKVLVLAPHVPEWRYGATNLFMPWYKDVRVVRQINPHDWTAVVVEARGYLNDIFCAPRTNLS